jgi:hypothetical protein
MLSSCKEGIEWAEIHSSFFLPRMNVLTKYENSDMPAQNGTIHGANISA